jgi:hypothetical protein
MQERPYSVTINAEAFVIVKARHRNGTAIEEAWPMACLANVSWTDDPRRERGLTVRQRALNIWVFVADITEGFFLGLDKLRA